MRRLLLAAFAACALALPAQAQQIRPTQNIPTTIATGNTFQTVVAAGSRWSVTIQNNNTNGDNCWIDYGTRTNGTVITAGNATKAESILLGPGGSWQRFSPSSYAPNDEIEATCATSADSLHVEVQ